MATMPAPRRGARRVAVEPGVIVARRSGGRAVTSVALEWRAVQPRPVTQQPSTVKRPAAAAEQPVAPRLQAAAVPAEGAQEPRTGVPRERSSAVALDASTIDRLADNVMQRIDRRIRIERERRGL
jgi:hypothetical protein